MKRRAPAALTREDRLIWLDLNLPLYRPVPKYLLSEQYRPCDRHDADLMHLREYAKAQSEQYRNERWSMHRRAWWPVHWGLA